MDFDDDIAKKKYKKNNYPKCYVDKRHDGDPICKECALNLYGAMPKKKFSYPRNCWMCSEYITDQTDIEDEPSFEDL